MTIDNDLLHGTRAIARYVSGPEVPRLINLASIPTFTKSSLNATWQKYEQAAQLRGSTGRLVLGSKPIPQLVTVSY